MDLRTLRSFVAIVDAGSLTRAAALLFVAQPALTAQIKKLEAEFGVDLLERTNSGVRPTPAGSRLYEDSLPLLAAADAIRSQFAGAGDALTGRVKIGLAYSLLKLLLAPVVEQAGRDFPGIQIDFISDNTEQIADAARNGDVDVAMIAAQPDSARLHWRPMADELMTLAASRLPDDPVPPPVNPGTHPEFLMPTVRLADAVKMPLLMNSPHTAVRQAIDVACAARGLTQNVVHEFSSVVVVESLYMQGAGYAFAHSCQVAPPTGRPNPYRAIVIEPEIHRTVGLAWRVGSKLSPATLAVITLLRAEIARAIHERRWPARLVDRDDFRFD